MRLRNKNTGEVWDIPKMRHPTCQEDDISFFAMQGGDGKLFSCHSLAELNEDWEDYKPAEPLIKDEKIRKAVRAWAEANELIEVCYDAEWNALCMNGITCNFDYDFDRHDGLVDACHYTIAELCGEEEE